MITETQTNKNASLISLISYLREEKQMKGRRNRFAIKRCGKKERNQSNLPSGAEYLGVRGEWSGLH